MKEITQAIAATSEIMGRAISPVACAMMAKKLACFPKQLVMQALDEVSEGRGFLTYEAVKTAMDRIQPDGRPGADEAWAMIPRDEYTSAVMTQEMAEALHVAQPLLDEGDQIAARKSFQEAYSRIVDANKRNSIKPEWFPSLGQDKEGRDAVLAEAVRLGRLPANHAIGLIAPDKVFPMLQSAGEEKLALEYKMPTAEEAQARIKAMKAALKIKEVA